MPKIFTTIDTTMKAYLNGQHTSTLGIGMPAGTFTYAEKWVESSPFGVPDCESTFSVRGRFDNILTLDQFGLGLVDLKTCHRRDEHVQLYGRQLHSYAWALENPVRDYLCSGPVGCLGLLVFEPDFFVAAPTSRALLAGNLRWIEIPRDDRSFIKFIGEVITMLDSQEPPNASPECPWCRYRSSCPELSLDDRGHRGAA